jgi:hypothetical protein
MLFISPNTGCGLTFSKDINLAEHIKRIKFSMWGLRGDLVRLPLIPHGYPLGIMQKKKERPP